MCVISAPTDPPQVSDFGSDMGVDPDRRPPYGSQIRLVGTGEPVLTQARVGRFLSSPQRVDVGLIGGEAGRQSNLSGISVRREL
jgi:hypothetical protein